MNLLKLNKNKGFIAIIPAIIGLLVVSTLGLGLESYRQKIKYDETVDKLEKIESLGAIQAVADFQSSLSSEITAAATTMTLVSTSTTSGEHLQQGKVYGFKLGGREYVLGTLSSGRQITSMTRGVSLITGTTTGGTAEAWGRGTSVEITDAPVLLEIINKVSGTQYFDNILTYTTNHSIASSTNQIPYAGWVIGQTNTASSSAVNTIRDSANTFSLLQTLTSGLTSNATSTFSQGIELGYTCTGGSDNNEVCDKAYIDAQVSAGAADANQTTKGIVEEATVSEINSGASTGGTGAKLFMTPSSLVASNLFQVYSRPSISYATSSNTSYLASTTLITSGQQIVWSAVCHRGGANENLTMRYKLANHAASTTLITFGAGDAGVAGEGYFIATTTGTITVEMVAVGCDQGASLLTTLYK